MRARTKGVTQKQLATIRRMAQKGYSANRIYRRLKTQHQGMRRTKLLGYVREFKARPPQAHVEKYYPTRRMERTHSRKPFGIFIQKQIAAYGTQLGKQKRVQMKGNGRELYRAMKLVAKHPPKKQFLTIDAEDLLESPEDYLERGRWDAHPAVKS
jgi:hypothetical protein